MSTVSLAINFSFSIFWSFEIFSDRTWDALLTVDWTKTSGSIAYKLLQVRAYIKKMINFF